MVEHLLHLIELTKKGNVTAEMTNELLLSIEEQLREMRAQTMTTQIEVVVKKPRTSSRKTKAERDHKSYYASYLAKRAGLPETINTFQPSDFVFYFSECSRNAGQVTVDHFQSKTVSRLLELLRGISNEQLLNTIDFIFSGACDYLTPPHTLGLLFTGWLPKLVTDATRWKEGRYSSAAVKKIPGQWTGKVGEETKVTIGKFGRDLQ